MGFVSRQDLSHETRQSTTQEDALPAGHGQAWPVSTTPARGREGPPATGAGRGFGPKELHQFAFALWDTSVLSQLSLSFGFLLKRAPWEGVRVWQRLKPAPNFYFFFFLRTSLDTPPPF